MDLETRADGETGPVSDPSNLIVGTIRPPDWLGRIPTLAWLFVALAAIGVAYPIWQAFRSGPDGISPTSLVFVLLSVVSGAATVLLPAAMLVGRRRLGSAGSWLLQGGIALAAAELLRLFGRDVVNGIAGPLSIDADISSADLVPWSSRSRSLVPVALLRMFGLARIGFGLGAIAAPSRSLGRVAFAVLAVSLAVVLVGDGLEIQVSKAESATDTLLLTYNVLVLVTVLVVLGLWAWVASIAARRDGAPWRSIVVGCHCRGRARERTWGDWPARRPPAGGHGQRADDPDLDGARCSDSRGSRRRGPARRLRAGFEPIDKARDGSRARAGRCPGC